ncbi:MAG TPA: hypothetical protein VJ044_19190 [Candidatus Hodarchaeales archaeon]|nr:hypothetical protein [Candidatus Hodarchaeales archaeon]
MPSLFPFLRRPLPEISLRGKLTGRWPELDLGFPTIELLVSFPSLSGNLAPIKAKIDSGANISLFPSLFIEQFPDKVGLVDHDLYGVVRDPRCRVPVRIARVPLDLLDEQGNILRISESLVAFSQLPGTPSLIGMKDILEHFSLVNDGNGHIEMVYKQPLN